MNHINVEEFESPTALQVKLTAVQQVCVDMIHFLSRHDGIGRHEALKMLWPFGRMGSNPIGGTNLNNKIMTKYVITSGHSVVSSMADSIEVSTTEEAVCFDTIGEAMKAASVVNELTGSHSYRVMSIEV